MVQPRGLDLFRLFWELNNHLKIVLTEFRLNGFMVYGGLDEKSKKWIKCSRFERTTFRRSLASDAIVSEHRTCVLLAKEHYCGAIVLF